MKKVNEPAAKDEPICFSKLVSYLRLSLIDAYKKEKGKKPNFEWKWNENIEPWFDFVPHKDIRVHIVIDTPKNMNS